MKPTETRNLITWSVFGLIFGYFIPQIYKNISGSFFPVSNNTFLALVVLDASLLYWIIIFRSRLKITKKKEIENNKKKLPPHPLVAARTVALAFAGSRAGVLILNFYLGVIVSFIPGLSLNPVQNRITTSIFIIISAGILLGLSLWLEKICRIKDSDDKPGDNTSLAS